MKPVPRAWSQEDAVIRVRISPVRESVYSFYVAPAQNPEEEMMFTEYSTALRSGDGAGGGGLLGVYATTNGNKGYVFDGYVSEWRYMPVAQKVDYNVTIPVQGLCMRR